MWGRASSTQMGFIILLIPYQALFCYLACKLGEDNISEHITTGESLELNLWHISYLTELPMWTPKCCMLYQAAPCVLHICSPPLFLVGICLQLCWKWFSLFWTKQLSRLQLATELVSNSHYTVVYISFLPFLPDFTILLCAVIWMSTEKYRKVDDREQVPWCLSGCQLLLRLFASSIHPHPWKCAPVKGER